MRHIYLIFALFYVMTLGAQNIESFFEDDNFEKVVFFERGKDTLSGEQLFMIGFSHYQLGNDAKAIQFYNQAIKEGYDSGELYFLKAISERFSGNQKEALLSLEKAIIKEPENQEYVSEKGMLLYYQNEFLKALEVFKHARDLPNDFELPYFFVPHIQSLLGERDSARAGFELALTKISPKNEFLIKGRPVYQQTLMELANIYYSVDQDFVKAAIIIKQNLTEAPQDWEAMNELIKVHNAGKDYENARLVFNHMSTAYGQGVLTEDYMEFGSLMIDVFQVDGRMVSVYKYFIEPTEIGKPLYKFYLFNEHGDEIERTIDLELIKRVDEGAGKSSYLLCEIRKDKRVDYKVFDSESLSHESLVQSVCDVLKRDLKVKKSRKRK